MKILVAMICNNTEKGSRVLNNAEKHRKQTRTAFLNIPPRYEKASLSDFDPRISELLGQSVFLTGTPGTGKTHLMFALAKEQIERGAGEKTSFIMYQGKEVSQIYAAFISVPELISKIRSTWKSFDENQSESFIVELYSTCQYLYLDDFGAECAKDWAFDVLYRVIDYRWNNELPIVLSSNLSVENLVDDFSRRIMSRILGMGLAYEMKGKDRRLV